MLVTPKPNEFRSILSASVVKKPNGSLTFSSVLAGALESVAIHKQRAKQQNLLPAFTMLDRSIPNLNQFFTLKRNSLDEIVASQTFVAETIRRGFALTGLSSGLLM